MRALALLLALVPVCAFGAVTLDDLNGGSAGSAICQTSTTGVTSRSVSVTTPGTHRLLIATVSQEGDAGSWTVAGGSLSWAQAAQVDGTGDTDVAVWYAFATSTVSGQTITGTYTLTAPNGGGMSICVYSFAGAALAPINPVTLTGFATRCRVTHTGVAAGSYLVGSCIDWTGIGQTPDGANTTEEMELNDSYGMTHISVRTTTAVSGSVTYGTTAAHSTGDIGMASVEVPVCGGGPCDSGGGGGPSCTGSITLTGVGCR